MPWNANNNPAGDVRAPALSSYLKQQQKLREANGDTFFWSKKLTIISMEDLETSLNKSLTTRCCAYVHPEDFPSQSASNTQEQRKKMEYIYPRTHAQFILSVRALDLIPKGCIALSQVNLVNLELCMGEEETWSLYRESVSPLEYLAIEIRPLRPSKSQNMENSSPRDCPKVADAKLFAKVFEKYTWQHILTENERLVVPSEVDGWDYFVRVLEMEAANWEDLEDDLTIADCFRGKVDGELSINITVDGVEDKDNFMGFRLEGSSLPEGIGKDEKKKKNFNIVNVYTSDDEMFPVKKKLLLPCIALSRAVNAGKGVYKDELSEITVDVDCCTFDRVLLYLEHEARTQDPLSFVFDVTTAEELLTAAITLKCSGLEQVCRHRLGEFNTRVRSTYIPWGEVVRMNETLAEGSSPNGPADGKNVWLVMQGMVFDVTRWLPEHPGGSDLIPREAVNVDCTYMFEIYHASRQSFRYLKQFYIGEIHESEWASIPKSSELPSEAFVEEFKEYTTWRVVPELPVHKSF